MKTSLALLGCLFLAAPLVSGCGDDKPAAAPAAAPKKKAAEPVAAAAAETPLLYSYNPTGKRDPFRSPVAERATGGNVNANCNEPLCQFELEQLTLVAVVIGDSDPLAMVEDPQGRGYLVRRNTRIGRQGGKVTQILHDSITVTELFTGKDGKISANPISVGLKPDAQTDRAVDFMTGKAVP